MKGSRPFTRPEVKKLRTAFKGRNAVRNRAMFLLGINTGFRISELLSLRRKDVIDENGDLTNRVQVARKFMKGKKASRSVFLNDHAKAALLPLLQKLEDTGYFFDDDYIFRSSRGNHPIDRIQAYRIIHAGCRRCGITGQLGTHCLRKTFANNVYSDLLNRLADGEALDPFRAVSKALGHADIKSTDKYLSFRMDDIDKSIAAVGI